MRLRTLAVAATLGATVGLSACSGGPAADDPVSPTPAPDGSSATSAGPSPSSSSSPVATLPASECLTGRYSLVRFVAVGGSTYGTGQGGDVTVSFDDGRYTLAGVGKKPMVVTTGGVTGNLTVDGTSEGTYALADAIATFDVRSATGSGTIDAGSGGKTQKVTMEQVDSVIGLAGDGQVACTADALTITLAAVRLELGRV